MSAPLTSHLILFLISILLIMFSIFLYVSNIVYILEWEIANISNIPLTINIIFDIQGLFLSSIIIFISSIVIGFSKTYIQGDPYTTRFIWLVMLFVLSINLLIYIPNIIVILIGWDGLGVTSFLLVAYYSNPRSLRAAIITALTNRLGDGLILIRIAWLGRDSHWCITHIWQSFFSTPIILRILLAACTKRAQIPFSTWLPAAIAAPTPVSALVHSSTLVTAGVFLLIRFYSFLIEIPGFKPILITLSIITMLIAGIGAIVEPDLKKIIALSTLRQLRVIIARIAIGLPTVALFHLITHALFKALLFVCAGTIIFFNIHRQDLRTVGALSKIPLTSTAFITSNLALCGTPFLAAFYSKDILLEICLFSNLSFFTIILIFLATSFTTMYTRRFIINLLWASPSMCPINSLDENKMKLTAPIILLSLGAISGGAIINWAIITPVNPTPLPISLKLLTVFVTIIGALLAIITSCYKNSISIIIRNSFWLNSQIWSLSPLSKQRTLKRPLILRFFTTHSIDQGWQELLGGQGAIKISQYLRIKIIILQNNIISTQLILCAVIVYIIILYY